MQFRRPSRRLEVVLAATAMLLLGLWRWRMAFQEGWSLSQPINDSVGTISWIYDLALEFRRHGPAMLFGDSYSSPNVGGGVYLPLVINAFWRLQYCLLGQLLAPDNVYDVSLLFAYVGNGACAYLLARELGCTRLSSAFAALAIASLEAFDVRVLMHNGLAYFYPQLLFFWAAVRAGKRPTAGRMAALGAATVFSFLGNEYYGYFSLFFGAMILAGYLWTFQGARLFRLRFLKPLGLRAAVGVLVLTAGMMLAFPSLFVAPLWARLSHSAVHGSPVPVHPDYDFELYSVKNPWAMFRPGIAALRPYLPAEMLQPAGTYEFTFPIGIVIPLAALVAVLLIFATAPRTPGSAGRRSCSQMVIWSLAILLVIPLAVSPENSWSLIPFTRRYAPMFRVGARALLLADIGFVFVLALGLAQVQRLFGSAKGARLGAMAAVTLVAAAALADLRASPFYSAIPAWPLLPVAKPLAHAAARPSGFLVEVPFYHHPPDRLELDLPYLFERTVHHHPVLNLMYSEPIESQIVSVWERLNRGGDDAVMLLRQLGVRWLAVRPGAAAAHSYATSPALRLAESDPEAALYEITGTTPLRRPADSPCLLEGNFCGGLLPSGVPSSRAVPSPFSPSVLGREATVAPGFQGFLSYGPYVKLSAGRYEVTFFVAGDTSLEGGAAADFAVSADGGLRLLAARRVLLRGDELQAITLTVELHADKIMEFRIAPVSPGRYFVDLIQYRRVDERDR